MVVLKKHEALQYWEEEWRTALNRFGIEGHIPIPGHYDPVSLQSKQMLRLMRAKTELCCLLLMRCPHFCPLHYGGLNLITPCLPFPLWVLLADIQTHLKTCKEKLCRSNKNIQINIHIFYWSNTKCSLKREGIKIVSGNRIT